MSEGRRTTAQDESHNAGTRKKSLRRMMFEALLLILTAVAFTYALIHTGLLPDFELVAIDMQVRVNRPPEKSPVAVVQITDDDYKDSFDGKSPLRPEKVQEILDAIALGNPKVIGVDLETDAPDFLRLKVSPRWPVIIWARTAKEVEPGKLLPQPVLGGREPPPCSGLVSILPDRDRVIRHYHRVFEEEELFETPDNKESKHRLDAHQDDGKQCPSVENGLPSFAWALMKVFYSPEDFNKLKAARSVTEELAIKFARLRRELPDQPDSHRVDVTVQDVLDVYHDNSEASGNVNNSDASRSSLLRLFENKIVLLGGSYKAARDEHFTPLGTMTGVEINAQIVETELSGGGSPPPHWYILTLILLFEYILLAIVFHHFHQRIFRALGVSLLLISLLAVLCSFLAFGSIAFWVYFAPILVIGLIRELYDLAQEGRKKRIGWAIDYFKGTSSTQSHEVKPHQPNSDTLNSKSKQQRSITSISTATSKPNEFKPPPKSSHTVIAIVFVAAMMALSWLSSAQTKGGRKS